MTKQRPDIIHPRPVSPIQSTQSQSQSPAQPISTSSLPSKHPASTYSSYTPNSDTSGYLGQTSYSSTLHDSEFQPPAEDLKESRSIEDQEFDPHDVALGVDVLKHIPDEKTANMFMDIYFENTVGMIGVPRPIVKKMLALTFVEFGTSFDYPWNEEELKQTAKCIIQNGRQSLIEPDDPNDWASKDQIRWDFIGLFFIAFAYAVLSSEHKKRALVDEAIGHRNHNVMVREIKRCIDSCITLALKSLCPRLVNLIYKRLILETVLEGDSSKLCSSMRSWTIVSLTLPI